MEPIDGACRRESEAVENRADRAIVLRGRGVPLHQHPNFQTYSVLLGSEWRGLRGHAR